MKDFAALYALIDQTTKTNTKVAALADYFRTAPKEDRLWTIGLFSGRGYNIESLTVAEVDHEGHLSRITIVTTGTPQVIEQIKAQLGRIVPVHEVHDLTVEGSAVERELALLKVSGSGDKRVEALRLADIFRAHVVDSTLDSFVFQITGTSEKVDAFADLMRPLGLIETARTGVAALSRGT